jgi:catechol 2,3-dioxygenase-like lactoylglutathione lyase family enzyme
MTSVSVRYIVDDVEEAISFYTEHLGCTLEMHPGPGFASLRRGDLRLLLNSTAGPGGASQALPDGRKPEPGGWNRFQIEMHDLAAEVQRMRASGVPFRSDVVTGMGGKQVLLDDPSGNPVELFEPA